MANLERRSSDSSRSIDAPLTKIGRTPSIPNRDTARRPTTLQTKRTLFAVDSPLRLPHRPSSRLSNSSKEGSSHDRSRVGSREILTDREEKDIFKLRDSHRDNSNPKQLMENERIVQEINYEILLRNLGLVVPIAKKCQDKGVDLIDLISEGMLGLKKAIEKFDAKKGFKLSTYAKPDIRNAITAAIANQGSPIRLPLKPYAALRAITRAEDYLTQKLGRKPTETDVARHMRISTGQYEQYLKARYQMVYLDGLAYTDSTTRVGDLIADSSASAVEEEAMNFLEIREYLSCLSKREKVVILGYFEVVPALPSTSEELGVMLGVSTKQINNICNSALKKMRKFAEEDTGDGGNLRKTMSRNPIQDARGYSSITNIDLLRLLPSEQDREVFRLAYIVGLSNSRICKKLGIAHTDMMYALGRSRAIMQEFLKSD